MQLPHWPTAVWVLVAVLVLLLVYHFTVSASAKVGG
jgi:hypothetical protein